MWTACARSPRCCDPVTFVEGTAAKLGDAIPANTNHTLTWDVGADWNIDLGQVKFEILARDGRGLLPFDWITIPAAGGQPALTISKDTPTDAPVLSALFWQYADGDPGLTLANGVLAGNTSSGSFAGVVLANGTLRLQTYGGRIIFKRMNLDPADLTEYSLRRRSRPRWAVGNTNWHAAKPSVCGDFVVLGWGQPQSCISRAERNHRDRGRRDHSLALKSDGTVVGWGRNPGKFLPD